MSLGSSSRRLNVLHWLGYWIGARTTGAAQLKYFSRQAADAPGEERSAWLFRCCFGCCLLGVEAWILSRVVPSSITAIASSLVLLLVLPKPTPSLILFVGRFMFVGAALSGLAVASDWAPKLIPADPNMVRTATTVLFWISAALMWMWPFTAFRSRSRAGARANVGTDVGVGSHRWMHMPTTTFRTVGGNQRAKDEIRLVARNRFRRLNSGIVRNGVLLYGPQGTGKNLLAEATAGEFRVNFYHVRCPQLLGTIIGSTTAEIRRVFEWSAQHRPIVMFLDEIDAIGSRKAAQSGSDPGGAGREYNTIVTQLMQSIDEHRNIEGLLIMAATNHLDSLDLTLVRDGRFDLKLRLDLPSEEDRREIVAGQLRQHRSMVRDVSSLARRTPGWSPARLKGLVDRAVLLAGNTPVEEAHLIAALEGSGGHDRPNLDTVSWDDVVLPERTVHDLQALLRLMVPGEAERLSLRAPSGLILIGAPGMGKTLTAKLIATQSRRSFYEVSPSEVLSGVTGGSVKRLSEIFVRAKEHAPSVLFFDEMDGLFPHLHSGAGQHDVQLVEQALIEISALKPEHGVFLIGTTNYVDRIDPRILRGGRFSEKIEIGAPDDDGYRKLISRHLGRARLASGVTLDSLVERVRGISPADLEATVTAAKRAAMRRMKTASDDLPPLIADDFEDALVRVQPRF